MRIAKEKRGDMYIYLLDVQLLASCFVRHTCNPSIYPFNSIIMQMSCCCRNNTCGLWNRTYQNRRYKNRRKLIKDSKPCG